MLHQIRVHGHGLLLALVLLTVFACGYQTLVSADYWFHLRAGESVAHGQIPRVDEYSFPSAGQPYVDLHWLFQLLLFGVHRLGGVPLAIWVQCLILGATFWLLFRLASVEARSAVAALVTILGVILASERYLVRPELLTLFFLAFALWLLHRHREGWPQAWKFFPLLIAVWVNVEGLFVVGLVVLAAALLDRPTDRKLWTAAGLSVVATCLNPYFVRGALHPLVLYTRINGSIAAYSSAIAEFLSPFDHASRHPATMLFPWFLALAALAFVLSWMPQPGSGMSRVEENRMPRGSGGKRATSSPAHQRPRLGEMLLMAAFIFLSCRARRNLALLAVVAIPVVARWLTVAGTSLAGRTIWRRRSPRTRSRIGVITLAIAVGATLFYDGSLANGRLYAEVESNRDFGAREGLAAFPWDSARFLSHNQVRGPVFTTLSVGSFLIWSYPQEKVFIDGRLEVHSTEHFRRCLALQSGGKAWAEADRQFQFNALVIDYLEAPRLFMERLRDPVWAWVHVDSRAAVFLRRAGVNEPIIAANPITPAGMHALFPALRISDDISLLPPPAGWIARHLRRVSFPWDRVNLGQFFMRLGASDLAAEQFRLAAAAAPDLVTPRVLLATTLCQLDAGAKAIDVLASTRGLPMSTIDRDRVMAAQGDVFLAGGRTKEAVDAYTAYLARVGSAPESVAPLINRALAYLDLGDAARAEADAHAVLARQPAYVEAYRVLGQAAESRQDARAALQAYRTYLARGGQAPEVLQAVQRLQSAAAPR